MILFHCSQSSITSLGVAEVISPSQEKRMQVYIIVNRQLIATGRQSFANFGSDGLMTIPTMTKCTCTLNVVEIHLLHLEKLRLFPKSEFVVFSSVSGYFPCLM